MKKRTWIAFVYLFFLLVITAVVEIAYHNGETFYRIESYAIDSEGRVLIGKLGRLDIYSNNNLSKCIELPVQHSYILEYLPDNLIQVSTSDDIFCLNLDGEIVRAEKNPESIDISFVDTDMYEDIYGNSYKYSDRLFGRKKTRTVRKSFL